MAEKVYKNRGLLYKENLTDIPHIEGKAVSTATVSSDGTTSIYYKDAIYRGGLDDLIPVESLKTNEDGSTWIKTYESTSQYRSLLGMDGGVDIHSLGLSLCPAVDAWGGVGRIKGRDEFIELYFNVTSNSNMQDIADFYNLENPLPVENDLDNNRANWTIREYPLKDIDLVLGSVVFIDGIPDSLKIYKMEKSK